MKAALKNSPTCIHVTSMGLLGTPGGSVIYYSSPAHMERPAYAAASYAKTRQAQDIYFSLCKEPSILQVYSASSLGGFSRTFSSTGRFSKVLNRSGADQAMAARSYQNGCNAFDRHGAAGAWSLTSWSCPLVSMIFTVITYFVPELCVVIGEGLSTEIGDGQSPMKNSFSVFFTARVERPSSSFFHTSRFSFLSIENNHMN